MTFGAKSLLLTLRIPQKNQNLPSQKKTKKKNKPPEIGMQMQTIKKFTIFSFNGGVRAHC